MKSMRDDAYADLVSIAGWLRGTEVLTALISKSFRTDKAELLNQVELVRYFSKVLEKAPKKVQSYGGIASIADGLKAIEKAMSAGPNGVTSVGTLEINETCATLVKLLLSTEVKEAG